MSETVHFVDEYNFHCEALVVSIGEDRTANLQVWAYGHIRLIDHVRYSVAPTKVTWHKAEVQPDGKSLCEHGAGYYLLIEEDERTRFHVLASQIEERK